MKHDNQIVKVPSTYYINDIVYNLYPAKEKEIKVPPVTIPLISLKWSNKLTYHEQNASIFELLHEISSKSKESHYFINI